MYDGVWFFQRLGTLTGNNKRRYAARFGYDFIIVAPQIREGILAEEPCDGNWHRKTQDGKCWKNDTTFDIDHSRAPTFGKIKLALAACNGRDNAWLLWSDADALIINQTVPLESIIDDGYDLILAYDWLVSVHPTSMRCELRACAVQCVNSNVLHSLVRFMYCVACSIGR